MNRTWARVTFRDVLKPNGHERSKAEKLADGDACGTSGPTHTVNVTMPVFEKCMQAKGWATPRRRVSLSTLEKLWVVLRCSLRL